MKLSIYAVCSLAAFAATAGAQAQKVIPAAATTVDGNSSTPFFTGYGAGRVQQIIDGSKLAQSVTLVRQLALRADGSQLTALASRTFSSFTLSLGYSSKTPATMSKTFATNRTGQQTVTFTGQYNLPAQTAKSRPFNILWKFTRPFVYTRATGNLLVEFEVPGQTGKGNYFLDAHTTSTSTGSCSNFGTAGKFATPESYRVTCLDPAQLKPGGKLGIIAASFKKQYGAVFALGFSNTQFGALQLPFDLKPLGAAGNFLNVSMDATAIPTWGSGRGGFEARFEAPLPNIPGIAGLTVYAQAIFIDPPANSLGLVFSEGLAQRLAGGVAPAQTLAHWDSTKADGMMTPGSAIVMEFDGVFN